MSAIEQAVGIRFLPFFLSLLSSCPPVLPSLYPSSPPSLLSPSLPHFSPSVRKERDEVLETYLDQPFDEYCITRKELLDLLRRHHNTTIELEKEKEEKKRWAKIGRVRESVGAQSFIFM